MNNFLVDFDIAKNSFGIRPVHLGNTLAVLNLLNFGALVVMQSLA